MTKPVTSVAALMLMEEGKLRLDDPITKWLPEFADMEVLKDAQGPVDETYPAPRDITVEDLMTHRSGLAYGFTSIGPIAHAHQKALGDVLNCRHAAGRLAEGPGRPAALLSAGRALPLQPRHRRAGLPGRRASRASRSARCCSSASSSRSAWSTPTSGFRRKSAIALAMVYKINAAEAGRLDAGAVPGLRPPRRPSAAAAAA